MIINMTRNMRLMKANNGLDVLQEAPGSWIPGLPHFRSQKHLLPEAQHPTHAPPTSGRLSGASLAPEHLYRRSGGLGAPGI